MNFEEEVLKSDMPVLVDFWAPWCGPCKMLSPVVEKIEQNFAGKIKVCKVNVDENMEIAQAFKVMSIPCVMIFKNGEIAERHVGAASYALMEALVNEVLQS